MKKFGAHLRKYQYGEVKLIVTSGLANKKTVLSLSFDEYAELMQALTKLLHSFTNAEIKRHDPNRDD